MPIELIVIILGVSLVVGCVAVGLTLIIGP